MQEVGMQSGQRDPSTVESVMRAARLMSCFQPGEPTLALPELVQRSGYSKTTTYRLLLTLVQAGWLERDANGAFRLTMRLFQIGSILVHSLDLRNEGLVVMRRLSQQTGLPVHLIVAAGFRAVCI
jgi:DNA-binding IclR family transcriptional regulator